MPTRLWSAVVSQLPRPVLACGRRKTLLLSTVTVAMSSPPHGASSRILRSSAQALQVYHQRVDLLVGESEVRHVGAGLHLRSVGQPLAQVLGVHLEDIPREGLP